MKIVYTVGTFDMVHVGHLDLLEYCASLGDKFIVGVASDAVVGSYKKNIPIIPLKQRMRMLKALDCVDDVVSYDKLEYVSNCKKLNVDVFVIGEDWGDKTHNIAVEKYLRSKGAKIVQVRYNPLTSSTKIKQNVIAQSHKRISTL